MKISSCSFSKTIKQTAQGIPDIKGKIGYTKDQVHYSKYNRCFHRYSFLNKKPPLSLKRRFGYRIKAYDHPSEIHRDHAGETCFHKTTPQPMFLLYPIS